MEIGKPDTATKLVLLVTAAMFIVFGTLSLC